MPLCTWISDDSYTQPTTDGELNRLLAEVRNKTGDDWRISERIREEKRWFRRPRTVKHYCLFGPLGGIDFQVINFYRPDLVVEWKASASDAGYVAAFLYGLLEGLEPRGSQMERRG